MKHLIIGDNHGFHKNLREFLTDNEVIDEQGNAINRDVYKVYSVGDLIDGNVNRRGDILNLEFAEEWFDKVCLGNHEFAFLGGKEFGSRRKHDRKTMNLLLNLIDKGIYVPAIVINNTLITHGGLDEHFGFETAFDAYEYIRVMWDLAPDLDDDVMIFDATGTGTNYGYGVNGVAGIFQMDWTDKRNDHFSQVVGHSTFYTGPVYKEYNDDTVHWNVDVGGKTGKCMGGIVMDDVNGEIEVLFFGDRNSDGFTKTKKTYPPKGDVMTFDPKAGEKKSEPKKDLKLLPVGESSLIPLTPKSTTPGTHTKAPSTKKSSRIIPLADLDDIDIALIQDETVLDAYRRAVGEGDSKVTLKSLNTERVLTSMLAELGTDAKVEIRNGVTHVL